MYLFSRPESLTIGTEDGERGAVWLLEPQDAVRQPDTC